MVCSKVLPTTGQGLLPDHQNNSAADEKIRIFSATQIFLGPLLRFVAEISAGWQR
jgi:hypothetical protein